MASNDVRWAIVASEREFRIVRRESWPKPIAGSTYSHLVLCPGIPNDSRDSPVLLLILYMLLAEDKGLGDTVIKPCVVPDSDPHKGLYLV
jgi:hypothetical protein